jgi:hypothetical protein
MLKELVLADDKDVVHLNGLAEAERGDRVGDTSHREPERGDGHHVGVLDVQPVADKAQCFGFQDVCV